ncbi:hypothetical protein SCALM49S_02959 [Streptomyces californicus]
METSSWLGLLAVLITTIGTVLGTWLGRTKTTVQEIPAEGMDPAPAQPEGTWTVSPEMYRWFQDPMASMARTHRGPWSSLSRGGRRTRSSRRSAWSPGRFRRPRPSYGCRPA